MATFEYPLAWPSGFPRTPVAARRVPRFSKKADSGYGYRDLTTLQAFQRLLNEIESFTATGKTYRIFPDDVRVSTNLQVRRGDGRPRQDQRTPSDVGIAVYLQLDGDDYCFPCDRWNSVAGNIAAVAAHLSALRGIERWGVGDLRTAFTGFQALPDPHRVVWRDVLGYEAGERPDLADVERRWKSMRSSRHPDKGGNAHEFHRVNRAYELACDELAAAGQR